MCFHSILSKSFFLSLSVLFVLLSACQDYNKERLQQADRLLHQDKESEALDVLKQCGNFRSEADSMRYLLLHMDVAQKMGQTFQSADEAKVTRLTQYYLKHGTANDKVYACYVCGRMYDDLRWPTEALRWFHQALKQADTLSADCDLKMVARVYGQIADVSGDKVSDKEFIPLLQQAEYWSKKAEDKLLEADIMFSYAEIYADDNPKQAAQYIKKAQTIYKTFGYYNEWADSKLQAANIWMNQDSLSKAQKCIAQFEEHFKSKENNQNTERWLSYWQTKAVYFEKTSALDSAICYNRLIINQDSLTYKLDAYVRLADIYNLEGKKDSTIKYLNKAVDEKYTDYEKDLGSQIQEQQANFDISNEREAALKVKNEMHRLINWTISVIILLTCGALGIYWRRHKKRKVLQLHALKHVEVEKFSKMLRARLDELEQRAHAGGMDLSSDESIKKDVIEENAKIDAQLSDAELGQMRVDYLQSTPIVKQLTDKAQENTKADEADYEALLEEISHVARPVANLLSEKRESLPPLDWQICLLIMVGMKPKAIRALTVCSSSKLSMRTRIAEKLFPDSVVDGVTEFDTVLRTWRG